MNDSTTRSHAAQTARGERFEFGANWARFLDVLNDERIGRAESTLRSMLDDRLDGLTFLDVGSGSGLMSLAARRAGATVRSFDFDPKSVACTQVLKERFCTNDEAWQISEGSILDAAFVASLERADIVYSWGVLHHTGDLWSALENAAQLVKPDGRLYVAIYNDQGGNSGRWRIAKRIYNKLPRVLRGPYAIAVMGPRELKFLLLSTLKGEPQMYFRNIRDYAQTSLRGMSYWHDLIDWLGGYPFEVAKPEEIFEFCKSRGFTLQAMLTQGGGLGCNEFVFERHQPPA
ncbi:MAG: class I SAM-dependent methyltransferase [Pseudomonadota bacterium]